MSESDSSIPQKVADLANALAAVCQHNIGFGGELDLSFYSWLDANSPDGVPWEPDLEDAASKEVLAAAAKFVEAVDTAERMLNAVPASVLEPLSGWKRGVTWDMRTRRTLKAIQNEISFLRRHSQNPKLVLALLRAMGETRFEEMQSKLIKFQRELDVKILNLQPLLDDLREPTNPIIGERRAQSDGGSVLLTSTIAETEQATPNQSEKDRELAFDKAIADYAARDWSRDDKLNNKAWRVRCGKQKGELFGVDSSERGWYKSRTEMKAIKKDDEGVWVYLTASHSEKLKEFFRAFDSLK
jgi:hypothetical protein